MVSLEDHYKVLSGLAEGGPEREILPGLLGGKLTRIEMCA